MEDMRSTQGVANEEVYEMMLARRAVEEAGPSSRFIAYTSSYQSTQNKPLLSQMNADFEPPNSSAFSTVDLASSRNAI